MVHMEIKSEVREDDRKAIVDALLAFNASKIGDDGYEPLAILLRGDDGEVQGGLTAKCYYRWLFIDLLFVPEALRGANLGSDLLARAEQWARERDCVGVWLDTFTFQAPGFYEKQGYSKFATLEHYPDAETQRLFFRKIFADNQ